MESFGIASDHFSFSRMRGARSLRRQHRAAHVLTPGGHRIPGAPWRRYRLGSPRDFPGFFLRKIFRGMGGHRKTAGFRADYRTGVTRRFFFAEENF
jgi:hypothetical protein